jgi:23S rRNA pseudouridine1911/1915/1917 synthase
MERERLDVHIVRQGRAPSRRSARLLIQRGLVLVNGQPASKGTFVGPHDRIEVSAAPESNRIQPNAAIALEILYADPAVIVVNKPGLLSCAPLHADETRTVMNAVVARFPETAVAGDKPLEGGLVHRLDNGTSGALMIARTREAFPLLRKAIRGGLVMRRYEALVAGHLTSALKLEMPIAHHAKNPRKMVVVRDDASASARALAAATLVEPVRRVGDFSLVNVFPRTGRRHQIRVHLAAAGHPIVNDLLYGGPRTEALPDGRFWLHLSHLEFESPASGMVKVDAPLPTELRNLLT